MTHYSAKRFWNDGSQIPSAPLRNFSALRHIEHLATLGLTPQIAIPEILRILTSLLPGTSASFSWVGDDGSIEDSWATSDFVDALRSEGSNATAHLRYNLTVGDRVVAMLSVWRIQPLRERERTLFQGALPTLRSAMASQSLAAEQFEDKAEQTAVLIATSDNRLVSADQRALHLLAEMDGRAFAGTHVSSIGPGDRIPLSITDLSMRRRVRGRHNGVLNKASRWGAYSVQIFPQYADSSPPAQQVVVISKHLPRRLSLMRVLEKLDLSPRERQAAFYLGSSADALQSAAAMGVSITTWRSYVKRVYSRLGVRDRFELFALLNQSERSG